MKKHFVTGTVFTSTGGIDRGNVRRAQAPAVPHWLAHCIEQVNVVWPSCPQSLALAFYLFDSCPKNYRLPINPGQVFLILFKTI